MSRSFIILLLLALPLAAAAQEPVAIPADLTLQGALDIAREQHPAYRVQQARLAAADALERSADSWLRFLPDVSFGLGAQVTQSRVLTGTDEFGRPIRLDEPISYRRTDSDLGPSISRITLFDGGEGLRQSRSTRAGVRATRASIAAESVRLESELIRDYYTAVRTERQIALDERLLESTRVNFEAAQRLLRVGIQDPLDVLSAELAFAEAEQRLEQSRGEARKARLSLADGMGVPREVAFTLADELPTVFDPTELNAEEIVASALTGSPLVAQTEAAAEQRRYAQMSARADRWPTVAAYLSMRPGTSLGSGSDPLFYLNPMNQTYQVGLNVRLNLFDRFQTSNRIAQANADFAGATESLRAQRLQTQSDVRGLLIDLENLYRALSLRERTAELSRERLELSQEKYRLGSMSFRDLQEAVDDSYRADYDALTAHFDFADALIALEEQVGRRLREF